MLCTSTDGNVTYLLSVLTNQPESEIEAQLMRGVTPWDFAAAYGKSTEFQAVVTENMRIGLDEMISEGKLSSKQAEKLMEAFENGYVS